MELGAFSISLAVKDISASRAFYEKLGFATIPPVEVVEHQSEVPFRYQLKDGAHRFYLSVAVGYTHIPAIDPFDCGPPTVSMTSAP